MIATGDLLQSRGIELDPKRSGVPPNVKLETWRIGGSSSAPASKSRPYWPY